MKQGSDNFVPESTPVIDLRKNGLPSSMDSSANDPSQNWDNDKTEVYMDSDEDEAAASLIDADGDIHPITAFPYVLGRGTECDLVLNGKGLSRKHVEIIFQSGRFVINDLDSLNGLKVNGYKVSRVILEEGDAIKLGEVHLTFTSGESELSSDEGAVTPAIPGSDPFNADSSKKFFKLGAGALSVVLILGGVIFGYQSMQAPQSAGEIVQTQEPKVVTPTVQEIASAVQPSITAPPRAISAPPPSISLVSDIPIRKPKIVEKAPVVAKAAAKPKPYRNLAKAKKLLAGANARYLDGDADELFRDMNKLENDSKLPSSLRGKLRKKHEVLAIVYTDYIKGQKAYAQKNSDGAFNYWTRFLEKEARVFKAKRSLYADQVVIRVVDEYVTRGNSASQSGESHRAYKMWKKAVTLGDSVAAKIALDSVNAKSKQLYRKALRLEYVNASKAKALWQEVVSLVPPGTEYYTKASSKLAWYERWGG